MKHIIFVKFSEEDLVFLKNHENEESDFLEKHGKAYYDFFRNFTIKNNLPEDSFIERVTSKGVVCSISADEYDMQAVKKQS